MDKIALITIILFMTFSCSEKKKAAPEQYKIKHETRIAIGRENYDNQQINSFESLMSFSLFDSLKQNLLFVDSMLHDSIRKEINIYLDSASLKQFGIEPKMIRNSWRKVISNKKQNEFLIDFNDHEQFLNSVYGYWSFINPKPLALKRDYPIGLKFNGNYHVAIQLKKNLSNWKQEIFSFNLILYNQDKNWPYSKFNLLEHIGDFEYVAKSKLTDEVIRIKIIEDENTFKTNIFKNKDYKLFTEEVFDSLQIISSVEKSSELLFISIQEQDTILLHHLLSHISHQEVYQFDIYQNIVKQEEFPKISDTLSQALVRVFSKDSIKGILPKNLNYNYLDKKYPVFGSQLINYHLFKYTQQSWKDFIETVALELKERCLCRQIYIVKHNPRREYVLRNKGHK